MKKLLEIVALACVVVVALIICIATGPDPNPPYYDSDER